MKFLDATGPELYSRLPRTHIVVFVNTKKNRTELFQSKIKTSNLPPRVLSVLYARAARQSVRLGSFINIDNINYFLH